MAKPKFELTADLVRVEPEPEVVNPQQKNEQVQSLINSGNSGQSCEQNWMKNQKFIL